jgi:hypothetical protein
MIKTRTAENEGENMTAKQKKTAWNLSKHNMYRNMMNSPAAKRWANEHGDDALIPGWGCSMNDIREKVEHFDAII